MTGYHIKRIIATICLSIYFMLAPGQTGSPDEFLQKIKAEKSDNRKIDLFISFISNTAEINPILDLQHMQQILLQSQKNKDRITEALALSEIGYVYRAFGNTAKSLEYSLKASAIAKEIGNEKLIANIQINLAHNYKDLGDHQKAIELYQSVATAGANTNDPLVQAWAFNSLGQVYMKINKNDSALMYAQRAYEFSLRYDTAFLSPVFSNLASVHDKMKNPGLARSYYYLAIKEAYKTNSPRWISGGYAALAEHYRELGMNDSVVFYARKAIDLVKNSAFSNKVIIPAKLLLEVYDGVNSDSALKYFKIYSVANDSLFNTRTIQQTQALTFEEELRQQQIAEEKRKSESNRKANIQYAGILISLIIFMSLFLLLSRSIIVNEKWISFLGILGLLIFFEFINLFFHPFIARITNHSPALMLAILVVIAALLIPIHHRLEHWIKNKLVEKNKKIRLAAARKTIEKLERT